MPEAPTVNRQYQPHPTDQNGASILDDCNPYYEKLVKLVTTNYQPIKNGGCSDFQGISIRNNLSPKVCNTNTLVGLGYLLVPWLVAKIKLKKCHTNARREVSSERVSNFEEQQQQLAEMILCFFVCLFFIFGFLKW